MSDTPTVTWPIERTVPLHDLVVRSDGDGRTVDAYCAVFDTPAEIRDQYGHYNEIIDRAAFNRAVGNTGHRPAVLFNHGKDVYGNPSAEWANPVAVHRSATPDGRGLRVVSHYLATPEGDKALELVRSGAVTGYSFSGKPNTKLDQHTPAGSDSLPTIRRMDLGLSEYGPCIINAYQDAQVLAVRSGQLTDLGNLTDDQLKDLYNTVLRTRLPDLPELSDAGPDDTTRNPAGVSPQDRRRMAARLRGIT